MGNINFVPDDYIQNNESRRANVMCLVLFIVVMTGLVGSFVTIKIRQKDCYSEEASVNAKMSNLQEAIQQFEQLQVKRKEMMKTALTTAELIEPVPRSIVLASLTNNLPPGTSLRNVSLTQKMPNDSDTSARSQSTYEAAKNKLQNKHTDAVSPERQLVTYIDITGMAPTDLQVAAYIERLALSPLLEQVALIESIEDTVDNTLFRHYKLKAKLKNEVHLTKEDVSRIRTRAEKTVYNF